MTNSYSLFNLKTMEDILINTAIVVIGFLVGYYIIGPWVFRK